MKAEIMMTSMPVAASVMMSVPRGSPSLMARLSPCRTSAKAESRMAAKSQATREETQNGFERSASQRGPNKRNSALVMKLTISGHSRRKQERAFQDGRSGGGTAGCCSCREFMFRDPRRADLGGAPGIDGANQPHTVRWNIAKTPWTQPGPLSSKRPEQRTECEDDGEREDHTDDHSHHHIEIAFAVSQPSDLEHRQDCAIVRKGVERARTDRGQAMQE